jgi:predicted dehydrogenase
MYAIIGGGFGLYGYLPAVVNTAKESKIYLPEKYLRVIENRSELSFCVSHIKWVKSELELFNKADVIVIARRPIDTLNIISQLTKKNRNIKKVILEKPVARTPEESHNLLQILDKNNIIYQIGYLFLYTDWLSHLKFLTKTKHVKYATIEIEWTFTAHHYSNDLNNWKRFNSCGGGALRFYGIHLIALASYLEYNNIKFSETSVCGLGKDECIRWNAEFFSCSNSRLIVTVDSNSASENFNIYSVNGYNKEVIFSMNTPFDVISKVYKDMNNPRYSDGRIEFIEKMLLSEEGCDINSVTYSNINTLWRNVESVNKKRLDPNIKC